MENTRRDRLWCAAAAALAAAALLTGCGPGPATPTDGPTVTTASAARTAEPTATATATTVTTAPGTVTAEPAPQGLLVEVAVTGGFAGVDNSVAVHHDGSYTVRVGSKPPRSGQLTPSQLAELRAALADPAYAAVPARPTGRPIADGFQYLVTSAGRQVLAGDGELPPALARVFKALPDGAPPTGR